MNLPSDLVAFWDFKERKPPYISNAGDDIYSLITERGTPKPSTIGPFGGGVYLPAGTNLYIPYDKIGNLNRSDGNVTVIAYAKRTRGTENSLNCIAGRWDEGNIRDGDRQYALFHHLPLVGGNKRPYLHVSATGDATSGWKYCIDGAATKRTTSLSDRMYMIGGTYDGEKAIAYLDGITDSYKDVTIKQTDPYKTLTSDRNPYFYDKGLNPSSKAPFRVNAARLGQHSREIRIGALYVFSRALSQEEVMQVHLATIAG